MPRPREVTRTVRYTIVRCSIIEVSDDRVFERVIKIGRVYKKLDALNRYLHKIIDTDELKFLYVKEVSVKKELLSVPLDDYLAIAKPCTTRK